MSVQITNINGSAVDVSAENFGVEFKEALIHQVVTAYQAAARSGTSAQKNRAAVRGGGKKPWRQKGTGRARAGTIRSPIFTGGGQTFANSTRSYEQKVNRKMYRAAMRSIWSELVRQNRVVVIDEFAVSEPKTNAMVAKLKDWSVDHALLVTAEEDFNLYLSARNVINVDVVTVAQVDPVSLVGFDKVVITAEALKQVDERLS